MIALANPDAAAETIGYWACTGDPACKISYGESVERGTMAVVRQVHKMHESCPETQFVLVGFGQGGQIMDNALCGGGDPMVGFTNNTVQISDSAVKMIKAAIFFGNLRAQYGLPYQVGSCRSGGIDPRPAGFVCPHADKIQSYCDASDAYCCTGNNLTAIQGYTDAHGQEAVKFVTSKLSANNTRCATKR
ncbi:Acetylxylan esterase [Scedosporium apiospermum]|uniref:Acetylxylan esterase n=1 Tax=Pseudallescheria apiosperma TaxID=563466 RepID=A0A084G0C6_PSEDA|nr:Acetylxylan esterase [Scedosporium apiospermum]KEZ40788.1 Acetylxylan esterase [Scedosporium apiospermum]